MKVTEIIERISRELPNDILSVEVSIKGHHNVELRDYSLDIGVMYDGCENTFLTYDPINFDIETVIKDLQEQIELKNIGGNSIDDIEV